jgi:hypothetical protein
MASPETYYDVAMRRLDRQAALIDSLDSKARAALGATSALVPIFGAVFVGFGKEPPIASVVLYGIAFGLYLLMLFFVAKASRVAEWSLRPHLETLAMHAQSQNEQTLKLWVANESATSVSTNAPRVEKKARYVDLAIITLVLVPCFFPSPR